MKRFFSALLMILCLGLSSLAYASADVLQVKEIGSFYVGGEQVTLGGFPLRKLVFTPGAPPFIVNPNGDFEVGQMYVQFVLLNKPKAKYPLLLWHGGGLTGVNWETTPDGRPGWEMFFLKHGHNVYVSDSVERGRASWARYPEIYKSEPFFRTKEEAWELFRIGPKGSYNRNPALRVAYQNQQFPTGAFDQFMKQSVPRWATNDNRTQAAYDKEVEKVGPCVIVAHSQGANFAITAALHNPEKVKALILIEPSGSPNPATTDFSPLKNIPHLFLWGDYFSGRDAADLWSKIRLNQNNYRTALAKTGTKVTWVELPQVGIAGDSHMLFMCKNSDAIATIVQNWMGDTGLVN